MTPIARRPWTARRAAIVAAAVVFGWALLGLPARAERGVQTTADEPQYLLSAISLGEDHDLDIRDELRETRFARFHEASLPQQTKRLDDGRRVSPHDPLLPVLLAAPVAWGGWVGAKVALAAMAGLLAAALVLVACTRFAVSPRRAALVVAGFGCAPPLTAYATQIYPELPAALAVTIAIAGITRGAAPAIDVSRRAWAGAAIATTLAIAALPWLAVKYAPVAVVLAVAALVTAWRGGRRTEAVVVAAALAASGVVFLWAHRVIYGGWTAYAAGDHFVGGELSVTGSDPDYLGRSTRLLGLLVDKWFGLASWSPLYLVGVIAVAALVRRRPPGGILLVAVLGAGWLNATFVAYTMHGWWWPGRQVVVVLPAIVLAVAWWSERVRVPRSMASVSTATATALVGFGVAGWAWLLAASSRAGTGLITDFEQGASPWLRVWQVVLPDGRVASTRDQVLQVVWTLAIGALAVAGWRTGRARDDLAGGGDVSRTGRGTRRGGG